MEDVAGCHSVASVSGTLLLSGLLTLEASIFSMSLGCLWRGQCD